MFDLPLLVEPGPLPDGGRRGQAVQGDANTAWVTDVTNVWTYAGWLYLAVILDLFSRRAVGWAASANNDRALAISALDRATVARQPAAGLVHHSDRGSAYASGDYGDALTKLHERREQEAGNVV